MSLRIRRGSGAVGGGGGNGGEPPPSGGIYGPTNGAQSVRTGAGNRGATYTATSGATTVTPSMSLAAINAAISAAGGGADIDWQAGTYPVGKYEYLSNQTWTGLGSGAVLTGAATVSPTLLSGIYRVGGVANLGVSVMGSGSERDVRGVPPNGLASHKNQAFWDDEKLWAVRSTAELTSVTPPLGFPGTFFHDVAGGFIYFDPALGNPSGHTVEVSTHNDQIVAPESSNPSAMINFTIRNFTVEKAGNGAQGNSALSLRNNGRAVDCTISNNHGSGIHQQLGCLVEHCTILHNGQINVHGGLAACDDAEGIEFAYCETGFGCDAGYNWGFEGGETKWLNTNGLHVHHSWFHDSYGMAGPWTDGQNVGVLYEENVVEDGAGMGIDCELGGAPNNTPGSGHTIRRNFVSNCGHEHPQPPGSSFGAGIFMDQTRSALAHNNWVQGCQAGIAYNQQPAAASCGYLKSEAVNGWVHHNHISQTTSGIAGGLSTIGESNPAPYFSVSGLRYENNEIILDSLAADRFRWITSGGTTNTQMPAATWTSRGQDDNSTITQAP